MKIRLFENFNDDEFQNIIKDCFSHLIDEEKVGYEISPEQEVIIWVKIETKFPPAIDDFFKAKENEMALLKEIKESMERIDRVYGLEYDVDCDFSSSNFDYEIVLFFTPGFAKLGEFYKETKHGIKLDRSKLKEILKLPNSVDIGLSMGSHYHLNFRFENETDLERYKDKLISDFEKLKINDKPINADVTWSWSTRTGDEMAKYKVYKNDKRTYNGPRGRSEETVNSVEFGLSDSFDYVW